MEDGPFSKWRWENWLSIWGKKWHRVPISHYSQKLTLCLLEGHSISDQKPCEELSIGVDCPTSLRQDSLTHPSSLNRPDSGMTAGRRFPPQLHSKCLKVKPWSPGSSVSKECLELSYGAQSFLPLELFLPLLKYFGTNTH